MTLDNIDNSWSVVVIIIKWKNMTVLTLILLNFEINMKTEIEPGLVIQTSVLNPMNSLAMDANHICHVA